LISPLGARNFHFLNRFEQNKRFKKCIQRASPKNSTLQGESQKKKIDREKNKTRLHYRGYSAENIILSLSLFHFFLISYAVTPKMATVRVFQTTPK
jgi:hypothetical protein